MLPSGSTTRAGLTRREDRIQGSSKIYLGTEQFMILFNATITLKTEQTDKLQVRDSDVADTSSLKP